MYISIYIYIYIYTYIYIHTYRALFRGSLSLDIPLASPRVQCCSLHSLEFATYSGGEGEPPDFIDHDQVQGVVYRVNVEGYRV